jgi:hypothetical protein
MSWTGEKEAWDILATLAPSDVERRAGASFDPINSCYRLRCFNDDLFISVRDNGIISPSPAGTRLIEQLPEYSKPSILRYLIHAKDLPPSGNLVKPSDLPEGDFFSRGTHVLPVGRITKRFENDLDGFISMGMSLGGMQAEYGDASLMLRPFPRVQVIIILWAGDDEFPPEASLLFDATCVSHMSTDILWSTAMMTIEMMVL